MNGSELEINAGEQLNDKESLHIRDGLSAVLLPELGERNQLKQLGPTTKEQALNLLNEFLGKLNEQGADIVSIMDIEVVGEKRSGEVNSRTETKKVAIIRKPKA